MKLYEIPSYWHMATRNVNGCSCCLYIIGLIVFFTVTTTLIYRFFVP